MVAEFVCQVFQELNLKILQLLALVVARWGAMASLPVTVAVLAKEEIKI